MKSTVRGVIPALNHNARGQLDKVSREDRSAEAFDLRHWTGTTERSDTWKPSCRARAVGASSRKIRFPEDEGFWRARAGPLRTLIGSPVSPYSLPQTARHHMLRGIFSQRLGSCAGDRL